MEISSADFTKLTLQKVADILLDHDANGVICKGLVDGKMYSLKVELVCDEYIPLCIYPYGDPRCSVHHRNICPDDSCEDFELIGRLSR